MFLKDYNKAQKQGFWILANQLVMADGKREKKEELMLEGYKAEMEMYDLEIKNYSDDVKAVIKKMNLSKRQKKILMFELIGLAFSDSYYDVSEELYLKKVQRALDLDGNDIKIIGGFVNDTLCLYEQISAYVNEEK